MAKDVIIACDMPDRASGHGLPRPLRRRAALGQDRHGALLRRGPVDSAEIKERGFHIFLDLKLCDIPNTVRGAMRSCAAWARI